MCFQNHFTSSENTLQGHMKEIDDLMAQLKDEEAKGANLRGQMAEYQTTVENLQTIVDDSNQLHVDDEV